VTSNLDFKLTILSCSIFYYTFFSAVLPYMVNKDVYILFNVK